ncbi:MAG: cell division protein ZapA [Ruminococcaceae bacterium]|nr:cell division protein ZapA [Oscillospiraceae bacterium]
MKEDKTFAEVKIHGNMYSFSGYESEEYIRKVCAFVDNKMNEISSENKGISPYTLAVLCAVNISDEYHKKLEEENIQQLSLEEIYNSLNELKGKQIILEKENDYLRQVIDSLNERIEKYES